MKYTFKAPPSKTEQIITFEIPDLPASITPVITGTTPIDEVTPPVEPPVDNTGSVPTGYIATVVNKFSKASDLNPGGHNQQGAGKLNTSVYKSSPSSFESIVQSVSSGLRSEIQGEQKDTGVEGGIDFWIYFPDYKPTGWGGHCCQFHPNGSNASGSATVALYHTDGRFTVWRNLGGSNIFQGNSPSGGTTAIKPNVWYHVRFIVKWSTGTDGWIKTYIDDMNTPYFEYKGRTQSDNALPNPKVGQNNFGGSKGMRIIYDDVTYFTKK